MSDDTRPRIEVTIAAPADAVWDALRNRDKIRHWHGWDDPGLESEIEQIYFTETVEDAAERALKLSGGDEIRLEPDGSNTRITLTRAARGDNPDWDAYYGQITEGWITFLHQLRFAVERRPGAARRTLFYTGGNENAVDLAAALGLTDIGTGASFDLLGENVRGEPFFRSEHQLGVTVDAWGAGLLIVSSANPTADQPKGAAMAVLSTYGLDDARLAELDSRWRPWWTARFPGD
jgi:uncharacterized protein YndB with AHSA1/START domain